MSREGSPAQESQFAGAVAAPVRPTLHTSPQPLGCAGLTRSRATPSSIKGSTYLSERPPVWGVVRSYLPLSVTRPFGRTFAYPAFRTR